MDIHSSWPDIVQHSRASFKSCLHVTISSIDQQGLPHATPIGSLFLHHDTTTGFFFEKFTTSLSKKDEEEKRVCVLAVNSSRWTWLKALLHKKFDVYPAIRLYGKLGTLRPATEDELNRLKRRMRFTARLSGHQYLWGNMHRVRDIYFDKAEVVNLGQLTHHF